MKEQMAEDILQPKRDSQGSGAAIGQHRRQKAHGVGAFGIADCLDVRMFVDVDARADGDALRRIVGASWHTPPNNRFRVRTHVLAQPITDTWERAIVFETEEK